MRCNRDGRSCHQKCLYFIPSALIDSSFISKPSAPEPTIVSRSQTRATEILFTAVSSLLMGIFCPSQPARPTHQVACDLRQWDRCRPAVKKSHHVACSKRVDVSPSIRKTNKHGSPHTLKKVELRLQISVRACWFTRSAPC